MQAFSFTSAPIAKALVNAHKRGVKVEVILDKSNLTEKYSSADFLSGAGITTLIDSAHAIAHNKVVIIDQEIVISPAPVTHQHNWGQILQYYIFWVGMIKVVKT